MIEKEINGKRTLNSKTFQNLDGSYMLEAHTGHIHYWDKLTGGLKDIKNDVLETPTGWEMRKAGYEVELPTKSNGVIKFLVEGESINYVPSKINGQPIKAVNGVKTERNQITYPEVADGIDLVLSCGFNSFRKEIIIRKMPQFTGEFLEIEFGTNSSFIKKTKKKFQQGKVHFRSASAWDSESNRIEVELNFQHNRLIKRVPREFLEKATYPVRTDTTTSYYTGAGDGALAGYHQNSWATLRGYANLDDTCAHFIYDTDTERQGAYARYRSSGGHGDCGGTTDYTIIRGFLPIDTSGLTGDALISAAVLHAYVTSKNEDFDADIDLVLTQQAATNALVYTDWNRATVGYTVGAADLNISDITVGQDNSWTLNSTGRGWINKTGDTMLGFLTSKDTDNVAPTVHNQSATISIRYSEYADTGSDPYLSVTYTISPVPVVDGDLIGIGIIRKS